jgi:hypothetical protein
MNKLLLITKASSLNRIRWAGEHLYSLLILSPIVFGITYLTLSRFIENMSDWQPSTWLIILLGILVELGLVGFSLPQARRDIYHLRSPESILDALPITSSLHLHAAIISRIGLTTIAGTTILIAYTLFNSISTTSVYILIPWSLFVLITALLELWAAINWMHWRHTKNNPLALFSILIISISAASGGLMIISIIKPSIFPSQDQLLIYLLTGINIILLYILTRYCHNLWREHDIEYARRLQPRERYSLSGINFVEKRLGSVVAAQLFRDLQLTLRAFSFTVYIAVALLLIWLIVMMMALIGDLLPIAEPAATWFKTTWYPPIMAVKVSSVLMIVSISILLPVLISYQLPHLWLERTGGIRGSDIWQGKLWYTRIISLPVPFLSWIASLFTGEIPIYYALPLLLECIGIWWALSTLIGSLSFEIPTRPGIAIIVMINIGLGIGLLIALFWPISILFYAYGTNALMERGCSRANYYLIMEAD